MEIYERYRIGTDLLIDIVLGEENSHRLSDVDWTCVFFTDRRHELEIPKNKAHKEDDEHYLCPVATLGFNKGILNADLHLKIPNAYFEDGVKDEIIIVKLPRIYLEE